MNIEILQNQRLRLSVVPELGASIAGLEFYRDGFWVPIMRPTAPAALVQGLSPDTSSYILAPYSNRIRDGRFGFAGETYALKPNWVDGRQTIHGEVHGRPWTVLERSPNLLTCQFEASEPATLNFPFPYRVKARYWLEESGIGIGLELSNTGPKPMPAGFGHHPYFMRRVGLSQDALLSFKAQRVYLTDASCLPSPPAVPLPPEYDFSEPRALGNLQLDHVFAGWDGRLKLEWPESKVSMSLEADPIFSHLVIFTAPDGSVALEPVSQATDGFNLMNQGWPDTGVRVLQPGETLAGEVHIRIETV